MRPHIVLLFAALGACRAEPSEPPPRAIASPALPPPAVTPPVTTAAAIAAPRVPLVVLAAGDVNLGRSIGQRILRDRAFDPFEDLRPLLSRAHLSFANLESPLSDQNGETQHPTKPLVFAGPPNGASLIARAPFHVVSVANNHIWDYGQRGFLDTLDALDAAGVRYAGASRRPGEQYRPTVLVMNGWSIALFAVTHVWNPGEFPRHAARDRVAWASEAPLTAEIRRARAQHDLVLVSYHGGREYSDVPAQEPLSFARAVMDAGADAVLAHHPHVPQGVGWIEKKPVFYSLGNLVFGKHRDVPWTARGFVARLRFDAHRGVQAAVCPYQIESGVPRRAVASTWPGWDVAFRERLRRTSSFASPGGTEVGAPDPDGCLPLGPGPGSLG